jgi:outer membrane receptor protein involved in Fe transport
LDKRVFTVGEDLSSTGASALEVLNNVPSVNVSIEGVVSLRGSAGVQILIDGKPSILADGQSNALGTITADMIESVEVITNPSAKYDAAGTAGILNIVLKKEEQKGLNGSVSVNTGWPENHSVGVSLNRRTQKFNLFTQMGIGYRSLPRYEESINEDRLGGFHDPERRHLVPQGTLLQHHLGDRLPHRPEERIDALGQLRL